MGAYAPELIQRSPERPRPFPQGEFRSISLELTERNRDVSMSLSEKKKKKRLLTVIIVLSLIFMGLVTWFVGETLGAVCQGSQRLSGVGQHPRRSGGRVLYVGMIIFQVLVALIPGEPLEIAGGYAFGAWEGRCCACWGPPWAALWSFCWSAGGASGSWSCTSQEKKLSP